MAQLVRQHSHHLLLAGLLDERVVQADALVAAEAVPAGCKGREGGTPGARMSVISLLCPLARPLHKQPASKSHLAVQQNLPAPPATTPSSASHVRI